MRPVAREPVEKRQVVAPEVVRDAPAQIGTAEAHGLVLPLGVPGVAAAVTVLVAQVVRLPRQGRHDDGDAMLAEPAGSDDERREPDASVRCP